MTDDIHTLLNVGRQLYHTGDGESASRVFERVSTAVDSRAVPLDNPAFAVSVDAETMLGLSLLLIAGERERGRRTLEDLQRRLFPDIDDLSIALTAISDVEQRSMFVFGQLKLVEIAADELDPPHRIVTLLHSVEPLVLEVENPFLREYAAFLRARVKRLLGQWQQAADDWTLNSYRIRAFRHKSGAPPTGYPPARSICEALLTLEAVDSESPRIERLLAATDSADEWDAAVLAGVTCRHRLVREQSQVLRVDSDTERRRTTADAWLCGRLAPSDADVAVLLESLAASPLACQLCYPWRAMVTLGRRGNSIPKLLTVHLDRLLAGLDRGLRRDYALPCNTRELASTPGSVLARCLAI